MKFKLRKAPIKLFALCFAALVTASSSAGAAPQPVGEAELKTLLQKYEGVEEMKVDFDQVKTLKDIPTKLKSKGQLQLKAPDTLIWTLTKPSFLEFKLVKGDAQITTGHGESASVQKFSKAQMASSAQAKSLEGLTSWLKFDAAYIARTFKVTKNETGKLEFIPIKAQSSPFSKIELEFSKTQTVQHLTLHEPSGDLIELEFQTPSILKAKTTR